MWRTFPFSGSMLSMPQNVFNPKGRAIVVKAFVFSGRRFELDEEFPHAEYRKDPKYQFTDHDLRGLWLADLVDFKTDEDITELAAQRAHIEAEKARIAALDAADDEEIDATLEEQAARVRAELGLSPTPPPPEDRVGFVPPPVVADQPFIPTKPQKPGKSKSASS